MILRQKVSLTSSEAYVIREALKRHISALVIIDANPEDMADRQELHGDIERAQNVIEDLEMVFDLED